MVTQRSQPRAIIFDFDGVIVDSEYVKFHVLARLASAVGFRIRQSDYALKIGKKESLFLEELFGKRITTRQITKLVQQRRQHQREHPKQYARPIPGVKAFIRFIHRQGIRICVATGSTKDTTAHALRLLGMWKYVDCLVTGEEYRSSKPNPEVFKIALRKLRCKPNEAIVIEDGVAGVVAAKRAGIWVAAITTTTPKRKLRQADLIVRSFAELRKKGN